MNVGVEFPYMILAVMITPFVLLMIYRGASKRRAVYHAFHEYAEETRVVHEARVKVFLSAVMIFSLVLILAGPFVVRNAPVSGEIGKSLVVVDTSTSMAARETIEAPSQLDRAKEIISTAIDGVPEGCFGLMIFSKAAFPVSSVTCDRRILGEALQNIEINRIPQQGTDIVNALEVAQQRVLSFDMYGGVSHIVLITDGGSGQSAKSLDALAHLQEQGIELVVVGVGSTQGASIPLFNGGGEFTGFYAMSGGRPYLSFLQESWLRELAAQTGGAYLSQNQSADLVSILRGGLKSSGEQQDHALQKQDIGWLFFFPLAVSFFVLLWRGDV